MHRVGEQVGLVQFTGGGAQVWGGAQEFHVDTLRWRGAVQTTVD